MAIPSYRQFIYPLLRHQAAHPDGVVAAEAMAAVADAVGLAEAERAELLPSGNQAVYKNRIGWAQDSLKRAGFSSSPKSGHWKITEAGVALLTRYPEGLPDAESKRIAVVNRHQKIADLSSLSAGPDSPGTSAGDRASPDPDSHSPDERIEDALGELRSSVAAQLLDLMKSAAPAFFESLVLDVLHAAGYGTDRGDLQRVGSSGDGGIDGIISLDKLGLEKVYVQAKRWQANVGRPELQAFYGALAGRRAKKGVFITTSSFTREAKDFAGQVSDSIVLVDGERLASLMIDHDVGVTHKALRLPKVDSDYFEDA